MAKTRTVRGLLYFDALVADPLQPRSKSSMRSNPNRFTINLNDVVNNVPR